MFKCIWLQLVTMKARKLTEDEKRIIGRRKWNPTEEVRDVVDTMKPGEIVQIIDESVEWERLYEYCRRIWHGKDGLTVHKKSEKVFIKKS